MPEIVNAAYFPAGTITVGTDGYKAAVTSAELVPTTPTEVIRTAHRLPRPGGIRWSTLSTAQLEAMPPLRALQPRRPVRR